MRKSTITDLPKDIEMLIPEIENNLLVKAIINEATLGEYHDFKNKKHACGKIALVDDLRHTGDNRFDNLIQDVINGIYDESPDEEDKANMKKDWLENGGSEEMYNQMFGGK